jgi:flagellar protein FlaG
MELDINSIGGPPVQRYLPADALAHQQNARARELLQEGSRRTAAPQQVKETKIDPEVYLKDMQTITSIFNRKLRFTIDRNSNEVIVKVIDGATDKVIKEIPPEALQRLHSRIRETIGLLIDEEI